MNFTIGLDVSTRFTGITILIDDELLPWSITNIALCHAIQFKGCKTVFEKVDHVKDYLKATNVKPTRVVIEEPLMGFSKGMSSATTITGLFRFNGMVSYVAREVFGIDPVYISAAHARKVCGLKMHQKKTCGLSHKEQTYKTMMAGELSHIVWPTKKSGAVVEWSRDAVDSYVIAKAGLLEKL